MTTTIEKILARAAELDAQAAALRLAATLLNGDAHAQKRATAAQTVERAIKVRRAQRHAATSNGVTANGASAPRLTPNQRTQARRDEKRAQVLTILRDYGKPMPIRELKTAARTLGIGSLTGMIAYVRAGFLTKSGKRGKTRYAFQRMPAPVSPAE
jgi:hypothetical protein